MPSGARKANRVLQGRSLRMLSIEFKSYRSPGVINQERKARTVTTELRPAEQTEGQEGQHRHWKQIQVFWKDHEDTAQLCRDEVRKAKAWLEQKLATDTKSNKKGFYSYVSQKRKANESICP